MNGQVRMNGYLGMCNGRMNEATAVKVKRNNCKERMSYHQELNASAHSTLFPRK